MQYHKKIRGQCVTDKYFCCNHILAGRRGISLFCLNVRCVTCRKALEEAGGRKCDEKIGYFSLITQCCLNITPKQCYFIRPRLYSLFHYSLKIYITYSDQNVISVVTLMAYASRNFHFFLCSFCFCSSRVSFRHVLCDIFLHFSSRNPYFCSYFWISSFRNFYS